MPSSLLEGVLAAFPETAGRSGDFRVGIDVVSVSWFARQTRTDPDGGASPMALGAFTADERSHCEGRPERFAARWAAKEAIAKAIGTGFRQGLRPADIEIQHQPCGTPIVTAAPGRTWPHDAHLWSWSVSLCHEGDAAVAVAVALAPPRG